MPNFYVSCIESHFETPTNLYGRFKIGPFEKNHTITIANNLRRTLLSELESIAIIAVKIQGVQHEYSAIKGVRESCLDILLNVKQIVLTCPYQLDTPQLAYLSASGKSVKAGDIQFPSFIQCMNPDLEIANLCSDGQLNMVFLIYPGKNYWIQLGAQQFITHCQRVFQTVYKKKGQKMYQWAMKSNSNILPLDAVFMPINRVNYTIEVDEELDTEKPYEHIFFEIWTNGSIQPIVAIEKAATALVELFQPFQNLQKFQVQPKFLSLKPVKKWAPDSIKEGVFESTSVGSGIYDGVNPSSVRDLDIANLNLSLRPYTCLKKANIRDIRDLLKYSAQDLLTLPNFGQRSLEEVQNSLYKLGMFLPKKSL